MSVKGNFGVSVVCVLEVCMSTIAVQAESQSSGYGWEHERKVQPERDFKPY